jgi:integrase
MIVATFNANAAKQMKPGEHLTFSEQPGLRLVASATKRSWVYRYAAPGTTGQMKQVKLGEWPALGFALAVAKWDAARTERGKGADPALQRRTAKQATAAARKATDRRTLQTCAKTVEQYLQEMVEPNRKPKGAAEARRMLERAIAPVADTLADDLTRVQTHELVLAIAATARRVASMTRQELRACWEHAISVGRLAGSNPFAGKSVGGKLTMQKRKRVLSLAEAGQLLRWMAEPRTYSRAVRDALELTLRTGLRSGEVCAIHTSELKERDGVLWLDIPGSRMKEGEAHSVPLIGRAAQIVKDRLPDAAGFIFPSRDAGKPIAQKVLGVEVFACSGRSKAKAYASRRVCPVGDWAPHDLRRTARTLLAEAGCPFEVGEAILAHALPGVAGTYNLAEYAVAKIEWLTTLNQQLDRATSRSTAK